MGIESKRQEEAAKPLLPLRRIGLRLVILAGLAAFIFIGSAPLLGKLGFILAMALLLGTYPRPRISKEAFENEFLVLFYPVHVTRLPLRRVEQIETDVEQPMSPGCALALLLMIGPINLVMVWLMDWLVPWLGGEYKLWLRTITDEKVLVWQGNGERNFRENLRILEETTGLPVTRA